MDIDCVIQTDVLVIGAGVSGCCAAIQAGRAGADVVLIEKDSVLGGNSGPNLGVHITGADRYHHFSSEMGIIGELAEQQAWCMAHTHVSPGTLNCNISRRYEAIVQTALEEAGVRVFKQHYAREPIVNDGRIVAVEVEDMASLCLKRIDVRSTVIEASGDGQIASLAGAEFRYGREARDEHGERSANKEADHFVQGTSLMVIAQNTHRPIEFIPPPNLPPYEPRLWFGKPGDGWHERTFCEERDLLFLYMTESGGKLDTIKDDAKIYETLLKQVWAEWDHIKNGPHAEAARNWDLVWISPKAGKRESRRFLGDVILRQQDLETPAHFSDAVAYGGFDVDDHVPHGNTANITSHSIPPLYDIPFRALYSKDIENLFLAGRLVSATHLAHSSTRLMRTGSVIGQAVGMAAAICAEQNCTPREIMNRHIKELRQRLLRSDATILGLANHDVDDLARSARVEATSEVTFNDQRLDDLLPLDCHRGFMLYDWPSDLRCVRLYLKNDSDHPQWIHLTVSQTKFERRWKTHEEFMTWRWRDYRTERFEALAVIKSVIKPDWEGWVTFELSSKINLNPKDPACEEDRLLLTIEPVPDVAWGACEEPCEIALSVEREASEEIWRPLLNQTNSGSKVEYPDPHSPCACLPHSKRMMVELDPTPSVGEAGNIINGFHRRFSTAPTNMWIARPEEPLPQAVTLLLPNETPCDTVEITFDTLYDDYNDMPHNFGPRAAGMCVKDYSVEIRVHGEWEKVATIKGNYHRRRNHHFATKTIDALRIVVDAVNESSRFSARIYEVRLYNKRNTSAK